MKLKKIDKLYKIGVLCAVLMLTLGMIVNFLTEVGIVEDNHLSIKFLAVVVTIALLIFFWNGLRLWFYFFEKVRSRYNSSIVMLYVGFHVIAGYWAYRKLRKYEQ